MVSEPLYWVHFALVLVVGLITHLVRRLIRAVDKLEEKVTALDKRVAIILDRDRRHRLADYGNER